MQSITRVYNIINWRDTTHFDPEDDYRTGCGNISSVNDSPIHDYDHPDDNALLS